MPYSTSADEITGERATRRDPPVGFGDVLFCRLTVTQDDFELDELADSVARSALPAQLLQMTPKRILCIRHGESTFNAKAAGGGGDPLDYDAPLSDLGLQQVQRAREALRSLPIELVITTPLTRALQTTAGLFADHPASPTILVESLHRERVENSCDVGRNPALLASAFPAFAFGHLPEVWWHNDDRPDERGVCVEPMELVQARADDFRRLLSQRPEHLIAVVGHGTFFLRLTGRALANCEVAELTLER